MKRYIEQANGEFIEGARTVPDDMGNRDRRKMQAELDADPAEATVEPYVTPGPADVAASERRGAARAHLASTDWYVTRLVERQVEIPAAVVTSRAQAVLDANG